MPTWVVNLIISFVLRQIAKFAETIDFDKVKADLAVRIAALVPGTFFDDEAIKVMNTIVSGFELCLAKTDEWKNILALCAAEKWPQALEAAKALLIEVWTELPEIAEVELTAALSTAAANGQQAHDHDIASQQVLAKAEKITTKVSA